MVSSELPQFINYCRALKNFNHRYIRVDNVRVYGMLQIGSFVKCFATSKLNGPTYMFTKRK